MIVTITHLVNFMFIVNLHYILVNTIEITFIHFLSILSVLKNHKPDVVYIHCNCRQLTGQYWQRVLRVSDITKIPIQLKEREIPKTIFGQSFNPEYYNWHAGDVTRVRVLIEYGGIYLDRDVYVVNNLDTYRNNEMTLDFENPIDFMGSQTLIARKNATFMRLWLDSYRNYRRNCWTCNSATIPTQLIVKRPDLVNRTVQGAFGCNVYVVCPLVFRRYDSNWRQKFQTVHLWIRGNSYTNGLVCLRKKSQFNHFIDEKYIYAMKQTFGEMGRDLLDFEKQIIKY
ncbi:uncharacterized protein LOC128963697 [Oppia nitens]|uniref:uncharacterized protein LOC128963697 n=1 Tax=Oppia nitens TaxID=1686743 RepID=UPI0023DC51E2|nr:uncharacterized protein LOC128963697 [Oppia nitens]